MLMLRDSDPVVLDANYCVLGVRRHFDGDSYRPDCVREGVVDQVVEHSTQLHRVCFHDHWIMGKLGRNLGVKQIGP
jgi:hypothetical protein